MNKRIPVLDATMRELGILAVHGWFSRSAWAVTMTATNGPQVSTAGHKTLEDALVRAVEMLSKARSQS